MQKSSDQTGVTLLGLGPGDPGLLTRQAWEWLERLSEVTLRTAQHPAVAAFPQHLKIELLEALAEREDGVAEMAARILELARRPGGVTYAVPGQPGMGEAVCAEIVRRAAQERLPVRILPGVSFVEPALAALGLPPSPRLTLVDGLELAQHYTPLFAPSAPVLVMHLGDAERTARVKQTLLSTYPPGHPVRLVHAPGSAGEQVEDFPLSEVDRSQKIGPLSVLYLPSLGEEAALEGFQEVVARLRAPDGCPWDREQTHESLRKHLLEETYETLDAMDRLDAAGMAEEFGDLLLQIVLNAQIGYESGEYTMADVLRGIHTKIVHRHPHVFGEVQVDGVRGVLQNWEKLKADERKANGVDEIKGSLDGVPNVFPSLAQAQELQDRAARVGFDWKSVDGVWDKVAEEIQEVREARDFHEVESELGDLLFAVVNLARWEKVDAEAALRLSNARFRGRFAFIERSARSQGRGVAELTFEELNALWEEAKDEEKG